jgi:hypothetical protein
MYDKIRKGSVAAVIGSRTRSTSGLRKFGKAFIKVLTKVMGTNLGKDINCGLRIMKRSEIVPYLSVLPDGFSASLTTTMIMIQKDQPIVFHPILTNPRIGNSKVQLIHGFETLIFVMRLTMLFAPIKVFLLPGMVISFTGVVYGLYQTLTIGEGFPTFAAVMVLFGAYFSALGLIADQISQLRLQGFYAE